MSDAAVIQLRELSPYLGKPTTSTSIAVRNAGDGLSKALDLDPIELEPGSRVFVVLECTVDKHTHALNGGSDAYELKQVLKAGTATIIDHKVVTEAIAQQAERIRLAEEAKKGTQRLDGMDPETEAEDDD